MYFETKHFPILLIPSSFMSIQLVQIPLPNQFSIPCVNQSVARPSQSSLKTAALEVNGISFKHMHSSLSVSKSECDRSKVCCKAGRLCFCCADLCLALSLVVLRLAFTKAEISI